MHSLYVTKNRYNFSLMKLQYQTSELIILESALYRTTTTVIIGADHLLLVDPNWLPTEIDFIKNTVAHYENGRACYLAFTHSDYDHIIGAGAFPKYSTIASRDFVDSPTKEKTISLIHDFDDKHYVNRDYPITYPNIDLAIERYPREIKLGSDNYTIYKAHGHNHDGIIIYNQEKQILIVGDYLSNIEFPFIYYSYRSYLETLKRLENLILSQTINCLIVGHGDHSYDQEEMERRLTSSYAYLEELEADAKGKLNFDLIRLSKKYPFPINTLRFHHDNLKLAKEELG